MADNIKLVAKEYVDAIETELKDSQVGQKTSDNGEIFSIYEGDTANKALSEATAAFGSSTKAGGKGFKIIATAKLTDNTGTYTLNSVEGIEVGQDYYSVKLTKGNYCAGKITAIDTANKIVTVDGYKDIPLDDREDEGYFVTNYLAIVGRPDLGDVVIGYCAFAVGEGNIAQARSTFAAGRGNIVVGEYGASVGSGNIAAYGGFTSGVGNKALGDMSLIAGQSNEVTGNVGAALGRQNKVSGTAAFGQGYNNNVSGIYGSAFGMQNEVTGNQALGIGYNNKALADSAFAGGASSKVLAKMGFGFGDTVSVYSTSSVGFGYHTSSGGKGFKITALSKIDDNTGTYTLNSVTGLEVGMEYSVRLSIARYKCGKILSISGTTITVDGYPDIALSTQTETTYSRENYLTIVSRPDLGDIDIGFFTATFGENCIAQDRSGFVAGRDNTVLGQYGAALGRGNTVAYSGFVAGRDNTVLGDMSIGLGQGNIVKGSGAVALGRNVDTGTHKYMYAMGYGCKILDTQQEGSVALGKFNSPLEDAIFTLGSGLSDEIRRNSFVVKKDGSAEITAQGKTDNSLVIKQYADTKVPQVTSTSSYDRVYTTSKSGVQGTLAYSTSATANTIAARGVGGTLDVGEPTKDTNATTKLYVDTQIASQVSSVYKAKGSITDISALPTPDKDHEGFVYNIENEFTTTDQFVEGAGKTYPAGTNVVIVNTTGTTYKYDVLAGMVDLSNYVTNDTLTTGLSGKLDKQTSTSTNTRAYIVTKEGNNQLLALSTGTDVSTIAFRTTDGTVRTATPKNDTDAATKKYVDDAIGNIVNLFASLVDMSIPVPTSDEPTDDTEIVNEPTDNEEETVNA